MSTSDERKKVMIHFVGTTNTVTVTGPWFDDLKTSVYVMDYQSFDKMVINMRNVTYMEVIDDGTD